MSALRARIPVTYVSMRTLAPFSGLIALAVGSVAIRPLPTLAQPASAEAEKFFRDGQRLIAEGKIAAACEAFEVSQRREPALSTLLNLGDCRERNQQYASAWGHFINVARLARQARSEPSAVAIHDVAVARAGALEGRLSYLIVNVADLARIDGLLVTRNGVPLESDLWNRDLPVDGARYVIEAKAPGYEPWSTTVTIENANDKRSVNVPRFLTPAPVSKPEGSAGSPAKQAQTDRRSQRRAGTSVALWTFSGVALLGGISAEVWARSTYDDARSAVDNSRRHDLTDSATTQRRLGVALDVAAVLAAGLGTYLWFAPRQRGTGTLAAVPSLDGEVSGVALFGIF